MIIGTIVAGILTLAILTFLYKDNPVYRMAESLLIGVSIGYVLVVTWTNTLMDILFKPLFRGDNFWLIIPFVLGLFMLGRFHPKTSGWSRISIAVMIGSGAGVAIPAMLYRRTIVQLSSTVMPLTNESGVPDIASIVVILGLLSTLAYFYFSREHSGVFGKVAKTGTYFLMIFFGTTFGYTVMSRMSTFIGRMEFLITDFFKLTQ